MDRVDTALARGLAHGTHRRALRINAVYIPSTGKFEAQVRRLHKELVRAAGKHLVFENFIAKRKHSWSVAIWLEPWDHGGVHLVGGFISRDDPDGRVSDLGIRITHHALKRLYQRLGTTDLARVVEAMKDGAYSLVRDNLRGLLPPEFAVPIAGGHLLFSGDIIRGWTATTYLGAGMRHDLPTLAE